MEASKKYATAGALVFAVSPFFPIITFPLIGGVSILNDPDPVALYIFGLAAICLVLTYFGKFRALALVTLISLILVVLKFGPIVEAFLGNRSQFGIGPSWGLLLVFAGPLLMGYGAHLGWRIQIPEDGKPTPP